MPRIISLATMATALLFTVQAHSAVLFSCGSSSGHAFYLEEGIVPEGQGGWVEEAFDDGQLMLIQNGETADIIYSDGLGTSSATEGGATVLLIQASAQRALVAVYYPKVAEHYLFTRDGANSQVVWTQIKHDAPVNKAAVFQTACDP